MAICYKKLWKLLIDRDMQKKDLRIAAGLSTNVIAKLGKNQNVSTEVLGKICKVLNCEITDISILSTLLRFSLSEREMGWCLTGIEDAIDCFERLEKEKPYDRSFPLIKQSEGGTTSMARDTAGTMLQTSRL